MPKLSTPVVTLAFLEAFTKGLSLFYFVLLPVFYAQKIISSSDLGIMGSLSIVCLIIGALLVTRWLHAWDTKRILRLSGTLAIVSSILLLIGGIGHTVTIIFISFLMIGFATGIARSGVNAVAAYMTEKGNRYKTLAQMGMVTDVLRMIFPILIAALVGVGLTSIGLFFILAVSICFFIFVQQLPEHMHTATAKTSSFISRLRDNKAFRSILGIEFLDSLSSSQLFVFLPLLFLAKGYSLQNSLLLQSFIFLGYLAGRFFVTFLAKRTSGMRAVAIAELGMVITIVGLLLSDQVVLLYFLSFALGVFGRGTSPAIKGLSLDSLTPEQIKKGSAAHVVAGDSGSALGQFFFGVVFATFGATSPFIVASVIALGIAVMCINPGKSKP